MYYINRFIYSSAFSFSSLIIRFTISCPQHLSSCSGMKSPSVVPSLICWTVSGFVVSQQSQEMLMLRPSWSSFTLALIQAFAGSLVQVSNSSRQSISLSLLSLFLKIPELTNRLYLNPLSPESFFPICRIEPVTRRVPQT